MKAILAGLAVGAGLYVAVTTVTLSANEDDTAVAAPITDQPAATGSEDGLTEVASANTFAPQRVEWNQDGTGLYVASIDSISLLNVPNDTVSQLSAITANETVLDLSSEGMLAIMRDFDSLVLRDAQTGDETAPLLDSAVISSAEFSPDGTILAVVLDDGSLLQTWDVESGRLLGEYTSPSLAQGAYSVTFAPSGESLTWYSVMGGQALDLSTGQLGDFVSFSGPIYDVQMCSDTALVVATDGGYLSIWDTRTASIVHRQDEFEVYSNSCTAAGEKLAVTTGSDVGLLDLPTLSPIEWLTAEAVDAELSPDGSHLAVVGADGVISVWSLN